MEWLNLSNNKLIEIPSVGEWPTSLSFLDISNNKLNDLPHAVADAIGSLNLSNNEFQSVPLCVCSFTTLHTLNLSENPHILKLPVEMGRLSNLTELHLDGLKDLNDPPRNLLTDCRSCISYLKSKLHSARRFYQMKLMLVGYSNRGKTKLAARLQGKESGGKSTVGVDISEWSYTPAMGGNAFTFNVWDFSGHEDYYSTHQCFLSEYTLYLLLFNLKHGDKGVEELRPWLNNLALRAPYSRVIIIGTHLDEVSDEERGEIDALLRRVGTLATTYNNKLQIMEVIPVSLKNRLENIGLLKEAIYNHTANYKNRAGQSIMGQKIPTSFFVLNKQLETLRKEVHEPIMHKEEFKSMVHAMNFADIQADEELRTAATFLNDVGSLLHYDNCGNSLCELYFVDPQWLCDMMSKIITIKELNPYIQNGILYSKDIPHVFRDDWQYFEQYLTLLSRLDIALPLDEQRVLVPSMLPDEQPKDFEDENKEPVYTRCIVFTSANTPPGFWSRLLSRIIHSVSKVYKYLFKSTSASEQTLLSLSAPKQDSADEKKLSSHPQTTINESKKEDKVACSPEISTVSLGNVTLDIPETEPSAIGAPLTFNSLSIHRAYNCTQQFLPSYPKLSANDCFDSEEIHLEYWRTGIRYKDPEVMFRIESLSGSGHFEEEARDGVVMIASATSMGKKIVCQLIDLVMSVVKDWFPGLQKGKLGSNGLEQKVVCCECIKQGRQKPFKFDVEQCLPLIAKNETSVECGYLSDVTATNHTVLIADIVPDLFLQDIDPEFILDSKAITYEENDISPLGQGTYSKIYVGECKGKKALIKKYLSYSEEAFSVLRSEAKLLEQSHHPCIVCMIGVCVNPFMAIVIEEPPLQSVDFLLVKKKTTVHRLTTFRIAAEVASALRFLHSRGIIFRDLKAANVLLWTLDPDSLCHCKLVCFCNATHLYPPQQTNLQNTKGFIAPEVLHFGKRKQYLVYDHRADIFSFGMFLYQLITRRYPYNDFPPHRVDVAVESGERPKLEDGDISRTGYHYLIQVMKDCWEDNPKNRPDTETIIEKVSMAPTQSVMCVAPIYSKQSLRRAIAITSSNFHKAGHPNRLQSELWVCCDGAEGAEVNMFNTHSMAQVNRVFIKDNLIQCMELCGDHVWVGTRAGIGYGVIGIFNVSSRELVHKISMSEVSVSCITATDKAIYVGTLEGYCFSFVNDICVLQDNSAKPVSKYISEYPVDGIACTEKCVWVTHTRYISYLNLDNLALQGCIHREKERESFVGQLSYDSNRKIIWSAHLGGVVLSAWDAPNKCLLYDVDAGKHLKKISPDTEDHDLLITAMTPALDTVWVGMASGHIMVFYEDEVLCWFHPYKGYVRFLTCIHSSGPCEMEKAIVASGGKDFLSLVEGLEQEDGESSTDNSCQSGTLILWEAYEARTLRQIKLIEENSPTHLDNHEAVRKMIRHGKFTDGTNEIITYNSTPINSDPAISDTTPIGVSEAKTSTKVDNPSSDRVETARRENNHESHRSQFTSEVVIPNCVPLAVGMIETFDIKLPDSDQVLMVRSPKPVKLNVLLSEIQVLVGWDVCRLKFQDGQKTYKLQTQEHLEQYLKIANKPYLCVTKGQGVSLASDSLVSKDY